MVLKVRLFWLDLRIFPNHLKRILRIWSIKELVQVQRTQRRISFVLKSLWTRINCPRHVGQKYLTLKATVRQLRCACATDDEW